MEENSSKSVSDRGSASENEEQESEIPVREQIKREPIPFPYVPESAIRPRRSIHDRKTKEGSASQKTANVRENKSNCNKKFSVKTILTPSVITILMLIFSVFCCYIWLNFWVTDRAPNVIFSDIKRNFPNQSARLWKAIETGITYTKKENKPTTYIFLYTNDSVGITNNLISELAKYATQLLSNSDAPPVELDSEVIEKNNFPEYGRILTTFQPDLMKSGVMIVKNLDKIPETYAQAFHSFCDQVRPLVDKSVFFLTIKVDNFINNSNHDGKHVEEILRSSWSGINEDIFYPLYTRLTNMILRVNPLNK